MVEDTQNKFNSLLLEKNKQKMLNGVFLFFDDLLEGESQLREDGIALIQDAMDSHKVFQVVRLRTVISHL